MLKKILLGLAVLIGALVAVVVSRPAAYQVERSVVIAAPAATVFPIAADLRNFDQWSPWAPRDPEMKITFEGPEQGVGQIYRWSGNSDVGKGSMTVTAWEENVRAATDLVFLEPFASEARTEVLLAAEGEGTRVTWSMEGDYDFMGKAMSLMMSMDEMIGADYERGLASLKTVVEEAAKAAPAAETEEPAEPAADPEADPATGE